MRRNGPSWDTTNGVLIDKLAYEAISLISINPLKSGGIFLCGNGNIPLKIKLFCCLMMENKILIADSFMKRGGIGPNFCLM